MIIIDGPIDGFFIAGWSIVVLWYKNYDKLARIIAVGLATLDVGLLLNPVCEIAGDYG